MNQLSKPKAAIHAPIEIHIEPESNKIESIAPKLSATKLQLRMSKNKSLFEYCLVLDLIGSKMFFAESKLGFKSLAIGL